MEWQILDKMQKWHRGNEGSLQTRDSELKSYKVTAYHKDPNPNAISVSLYLSPIVPSYE